MGTIRSGALETGSAALYGESADVEGGFVKALACADLRPRSVASDENVVG